MSGARLRVVLDTNIVVSALIFESGSLAWSRAAWREGSIVPLVCRETVSELLRVLAYPKFQLSEAERALLLEDFLPFAETVTWRPPAADLPQCRDPADQVFLALAANAGADYLVSGDGDLLALAGELACPVISVPELAGQLR